MPAKTSKNKTTKHSVEIPDSTKKLSFEVEFVPADQMPSSIAKSTNVAKVKLGGKDFFLVMGKTTLM